MDVEWDEAKDLANRQKHGLGFAEAAELFESGVDYLEIFDVDHSESEDRFIAMGRSLVGSSSPSTRSLMKTRFVSSARVRPRVASSHSFATTWMESDD